MSKASWNFTKKQIMSGRNPGSGKIIVLIKSKNLCGTVEDPELPK